MALNIVFNEFGFLESDSDMSTKLSPILKHPPISPNESESSSGISSLDSDDLKKQLLSSPPTISNSHDQDDEDQQSNDGDGILNEKEEQENYDVEENEKDNIIEPVLMPKVLSPVKVIYQNRNILNLAENIWNSGRFQYAVLPDNNLSCFFQNRAQYWRLGSSSGSERHDTLKKCLCCDFYYPSIYHQQLSQNGLYIAKNNAITDSLLTFLKIHHVDFNNKMPNSNDNSNMNSKNINNNININNNMNNNNKSSNIIGNNKQRMYNNNNSYAAYQIIQQQQQYQNNGYFNSTMNEFSHQINSCNNNGSGGGYNNNRTSAIGALNLMNQSRNVTNAFQQTMNNNSHYYNNNMNNNNNNNGLYKQF